MEVNFKKALAWVRESEGGNDDDPDDPGGRTSRGITQREFDAYCEIAGLPQGDVWKAPEQVVDDIYHRSYWMPYGPLLPAGLDYAFFDACVNTGLYQSTKHLQRALAVFQPAMHIRDDGHIGVITSAALSKTDIKALLGEFANQRIKSYKSFRGFWKYGKGWLARVEFARKNALSLLNGGA